MKPVKDLPNHLQIVDQTSQNPSRNGLRTSAKDFPGTIDAWEASTAAFIASRKTEKLAPVRLIDGSVFYLPSHVANHLRPYNQPDLAVAIAQSEMRDIANYLIYGVLPAMSGFQRTILARIAAAYDLPLLAAAVGDRLASWEVVE